MMVSTITAKGKTTVPAPVLAHMRAGPGTRLVWHIFPDGSVFVRAKSTSILALAGILARPKGKAITVKDMDPWKSGIR